MARIVNLAWAAKMERLVFSDDPVDVTTQYAILAQWLIVNLSNAKRGFQVVNLGAGVRRITTDTKVCPKCNGTGRC